MKLILIISLSFILSTKSFAGLSCSANGLNMLYINGVNVNLDGNKATTKNLTRVIEPMLSELDSNSNKSFKLNGIWNTSSGLLNDIEEIKAQLAANHNGDKRIEYWRKLAEYKIYPQVAIPGNFASEAEYAAEKKKIDDALVQITSKPDFKIDQDGTIDQNTYTQSDFYKDLIKYNSSLASLLATAASDIAVVQQLKIKIKEAYNGGANKLIVVAHSQGNEVLYSAVQDLRNDRSFLVSQNDVTKFDGLIGYMQVAPPSPKLVTSPVAIEDVNNHSQYIRHNRDGIIGISNAMTGFKPVDANYTSEVGIPPEGFPTFASAVSNFLDNLFNTYLNKGIWTLYHGMDDVYLSDSYKSTRNSNGSNKALVEHFKDNMREIASKLEPNCGGPIVRFKSANGTSSNGVMLVDGFAGPDRSINIKIDDIAIDENSSIALQRGYDHSKTTFDWKIEIKHPILATKTEIGVGPDITLELPYRDYVYSIVVTATNMFGNKATYSQKIQIINNKPPEVSLISTECNPDSDGYNRAGLMDFVLQLTDDEYIYNGKLISGSVGVEPIDYKITDSSNIVFYKLESTCAASAPVYHWKTSVTCQKGNLNICYGSCPVLPPGSYDIVNTGLQWTTIIVYNEKNQIQKSIFLAEANNELGASYRTFVDPVDLVTNVTINVAGSCPRGGYGPDTFEF